MDKKIDINNLSGHALHCIGILGFIQSGNSGKAAVSICIVVAIPFHCLVLWYIQSGEALPVISSLVLNSVTGTLLRPPRPNNRAQAPAACAICEALPHLGGCVWVGSWSPTVRGFCGNMQPGPPSCSRGTHLPGLSQFFFLPRVAAFFLSNLA